MQVRLFVPVVLFALFACGGAESAPRPRDPSATAGASRHEPEPPTARATPDVSTEPPAAGSMPAAEVPTPGSASGWPFGPDPGPESQRVLLDRLAKDPGPQKTNWTPPGRRERYGHAEGIVAASPAEVKKRLNDFGHYKELAGPKFKQVRVVGKEGDGTDVYFQLPIMKGLVTIWYVTRFLPPRTAAGGEVVEGTFVKGNIKGMHIVLKVQPGGGDQESVMTCDLLLAPGLPAPQSAVDEELRDACGDAIVSVRKLTGG